MRTPFRVNRLVSVVVHGDGRHMHTWRLEDGTSIQTMMFHPYPRKVDMTLDHGRSTLVEFWHTLDGCVDRIRAGSSIEPELEKTRATTYAEVLASLMSPFYPDRDAVLRESMARWTARQEGREHQSPGLAEAIWDPSSRFDGTPYSEANERAVRSGGAKPVPARLDDAKRNFIKLQLDSGAMTPEVLAGMFQVSIEVIEANYDA